MIVKRRKWSKEKEGDYDESRDSENAKSEEITDVVAILLSAGTLAKEFMVGDDSGWTIKFDYQASTVGNEFEVEDKLVFKYPSRAHNVFKVNRTDFQACTAPPKAVLLTTGTDIIALTTPGKKWYICDVGKHCEIGGQKLVITVRRSTRVFGFSTCTSSSFPYQFSYWI
ncbi:hypothetical protein GIB67_034316, partial [Kingdonia uniflora]